jgi:hypothetical protein
VTESSEVRRASQSDRQCVREWRWWRKEQKEKEQTKSKKGEEGPSAKRRTDSIKSNSMKEEKSRMEDGAPNTKLNPDQDKLA